MKNLPQCQAELLHQVEPDNAAKQASGLGSRCPIHPKP